MKRLLIIPALIITTSLFGQIDERLLSDEKRQEIEGMKVAYLTSKMNLTTEEAQAFWPVYNEYRAEMDAHRQDGMKKLESYRLEKEDLTDEELLQFLETKFDHERGRIEIEEKYVDRFLEVVSPQKVAKLLEAEEGFKRVLLRRVAEDRDRMRDRR